MQAEVLPHAGAKGGGNEPQPMPLYELAQRGVTPGSRGHGGLVFGLATRGENEDPEQAARLFGASSTVREDAAYLVLPSERRVYYHAVSTMHDQLGKAAFEQAVHANGPDQ